MKKQYIVLSESNHYGWCGGLITLAKAKRYLKLETEIFYIFHCAAAGPMSRMKIRYPFGEYYDSLSINEYKEKYLMKMKILLLLHTMIRAIKIV